MVEAYKKNMIRSIISISSVIIITALSVVVNLIFLPLHSLGLIIWSRFVLAIVGVKFKVIGGEDLSAVNPCIILINHESALDIPIAVAATRKPVRFMAKQELFRVPFFGWLMRISNHIPIDRKDRQKAIKSIERVSAKLVKKKISIIVSPEGTRSHTGEIAPFKKGAFRLAQSHNLPIVPVTIMGARHCIPNKTLTVIPGVVTVHIGKPVYTNQFKDIDECIKNVRNSMVALKKEYEQKRLISA
ncbi:1-acyl-sn-glycerol-3-phosphate acyltransferase [bacterium]|nr:1-acyl-sn-glycerol-3-phosphate acyltransferase [bacterium]MBU1874513.1 1-acyl-sn-glycerol-3-phosphate acyltransferase [bacterium]